MAAFYFDISRGWGVLSCPVSKFQHSKHFRINLRLFSGIQPVFWGYFHWAGLILRGIRFFSDWSLGKTKRRSAIHHLFFDMDAPADHLAFLAGTAFHLPAFAAIYIFRLPRDEIYP